VCAALREGAVETLLIGDLGDATVLRGDNHETIAPNANVLSELGTAPASTVRADEALPLAAVAIDADLVLIGDRVAPRDGVGAVLRYAPRTAASD
jgi:peptide chain release factor subunit 1